MSSGVIEITKNLFRDWIRRFSGVYKIEDEMHELGEIVQGIDEKVSEANEIRVELEETNNGVEGLKNTVAGLNQAFAHLGHYVGRHIPQLYEENDRLAGRVGGLEMAPAFATPPENPAEEVQEDAPGRFGNMYFSIKSGLGSLKDKIKDSVNRKAKGQLSPDEILKAHEAIYSEKEEKEPKDLGFLSDLAIGTGSTVLDFVKGAAAPFFVPTGVRMFEENNISEVSKTAYASGLALSALTLGYCATDLAGDFAMAKYFAEQMDPEVWKLAVPGAAALTNILSAMYERGRDRFDLFD